MKAFTVSELNHHVAELIKGDKSLQHIWLKGEISNFKAHTSGHLYFSLKDTGGVIKAVMFRGMVSRLRFRPENGMTVLVSAGVTVYEAGGVYQLTVWDMLPEGAGAVQQQLEERKERLRKAGLFEESSKRPLPANPRTVGVVTSPTGAALQDILQIIGRRCPSVRVKVFPVQVQGAAAPASITAGLRFAATQDCDVLILGRGGGAAEDLDAFNAENVAYAVYDCPVPVISAVGHETDFTIADAVADRRAPTPSAAAELAVPDTAHLHEQLRIAERGLRASYEASLQRRLQQLNGLDQRLGQCRPDHRIRLQQEECRRLTMRLEKSMQLLLARKLSAYQTMQEKLSQLDPLRVLQRGYAAVYHENGKLLSSVGETKPGELLKVRLSDGSLQVKVDAINEL
ncbi:MAG: exodeoxyribonuclease VII large subunit [Oscillospiraceae bacterium]|nr:exodeoxyribonuclease VII large subunit [Oscillospiraceae bacterium]